MPILYTVQIGDTLLSIAQRFGTTIPMLARTNSISFPYVIYIGQRLIIPAEISSQQISGVAPHYSLEGHNYTPASGYINQDPLDQEAVEKIIGKKGTMQGGVLKFTFPRYDLKVNIGPVSIEPELALTSWMAFHQVGNQSMIMGDLVLPENEIDPVISQIIAYGLEISALHNHLLYELPRIMYLHISGIGDAVKLAQGIKNVFSATQTPLTGHPASQTLPPEYWSTVEGIMGKKGNRVGRVIQFSYPRADITKEFGVEIPPSMGISQAVNFQAEGQKAAATGDFVLIANEVNSVVRTLKQYGITITAIHNHMLYESPRLFFLHFWAVDNPERLAYGLRQALVQTNTAAPIGMT
jgi:murein DD-endopeptidase MepM/ murein hydrolase activator NlpD